MHSLELPMIGRLAHAMIRPAVEDDFVRIAAIYEHYVLTSTATFEVTPPSPVELAKRARDVLSFGGPYLVAASPQGVLGYAYAGMYRARAAYRLTVENTVYVAPEHLGQGVGKALLGAIIAECERGGFAEMVAVIGGEVENRASIRLHESCGFAHAGTLRRVGNKFGRWLDTVLMQRGLSAGAAPHGR
ncbi:N-acetyltransferase family protein [Azospirillum sp.]|uniref:GNAT family N-acetyltransferase n=1 Tax=Azospirillum sp. TaxID=34012 RepID=UPI003D72F7FB